MRTLAPPWVVVTVTLMLFVSPPLVPPPQSVVTGTTAMEERLCVQTAVPNADGPDAGLTNKQSILGSIPYWDQGAAYTSFRKNFGHFDFISVFWYHLSVNGKVRKYAAAAEDRSIITTAHRHKVKVLALVANLPDYGEAEDDWDPERVERAIASSRSRQHHIASLLRLVESKGFDGINIDYEGLERPQRERFSLFIEGLARGLHARGKILGVAIHPKTSEDNPEESYGAHAQDLSRLGRAADHLYFMTYLEHGAWSGPGPTGSINWTRKVMRYAIDEAGVPRQKAFLGIGLVGNGWYKPSGGTYRPQSGNFIHERLLSILRTHNGRMHWDATAKAPYARYRVRGNEHIVWFENARGVAARTELAKALKVGGIHFWRLGGEDPRIWASPCGSR